MNTLPALSMPPIEHIYLGGESASKPEIEISKGIQEIEIIIKHNRRQEIYNIQQSIYRNTVCLYRLLYRILSLIEETFNPNSYYPKEYSEISDSIMNLLGSPEFNEDDITTLCVHLSHIGESIGKIHSILLSIFDIKTATACHNLRNYFSMTPPDESLKMSNYITANHSGQRISLFQTFTENPMAFWHLFLTHSIEIEKHPPNDKGNIKKDHIRIHFREEGIDIADFDLRTNSIGNLYYDLLSAILHDAIPHYTKPDDISKRYLACNTLCTIIVMESLLINWKNLSKCLKCYYNSAFRRYVFSPVIHELSKKLSEDNPVSKKLSDVHVQLMFIIEAIEIEKERYRQNFANYMKYVQTISRDSSDSINSIIAKRIFH